MRNESGVGGVGGAKGVPRAAAACLTSAASLSRRRASGSRDARSLSTARRSFSRFSSDQRDDEANSLSGARSRTPGCVRPAPVIETGGGGDADADAGAGADTDADASAGAGASAGARAGAPVSDTSGGATGGDAVDITSPAAGPGEVNGAAAGDAPLATTGGLCGGTPGIGAKRVASGTWRISSSMLHTRSRCSPAAGTTGSGAPVTAFGRFSGLGRADFGALTSGCGGLCGPVRAGFVRAGSGRADGDITTASVMRGIEALPRASAGTGGKSILRSRSRSRSSSRSRAARQIGSEREGDAVESRSAPCALPPRLALSRRAPDDRPATAKASKATPTRPATTIAASPAKERSSAPGDSGCAAPTGPTRVAPSAATSMTISQPAHRPARVRRNFKRTRAPGRPTFEPDFVQPHFDSTPFPTSAFPWLQSTHAAGWFARAAVNTNTKRDNW